MAKDELLAIDRTYELLKWFLGRLCGMRRLIGPPLYPRYSKAQAVCGRHAQTAARATSATIS
ncbi:MAG TPA: hypothetical protein VMZ31_02445 [Phycisphaerae bacterium]|nr:hypothetical protein [Phycisphaerae bacterium]